MKKCWPQDEIPGHSNFMIAYVYMAGQPVVSEQFAVVHYLNLGLHEIHTLDTLHECETTCKHVHVHVPLQAHCIVYMNTCTYVYACTSM